MKIRTLLFATALLALAGSAFAASPPPPASTGMGPGAHHEGPCEKDPAQCKADAAKFDQWCSANADKCMKLKAWAEHRREACEANKPKCEERMEKMHKMHEHMKEMCAKNPSDEHCKMMKDMKPDEPGADQMPPPPA